MGRDPECGSAPIWEIGIELERGDHNESSKTTDAQRCGQTRSHTMAVTIWHRKLVAARGSSDGGPAMESSQTGGGDEDFGGCDARWDAIESSEDK